MNDVDFDSASAQRPRCQRSPCSPRGRGVSILSLVGSALAAGEEVAGGEDHMEEVVLVEEPMELGTWTCSWRQ